MSKGINKPTEPDSERRKMKSYLRSVRREGGEVIMEGREVSPGYAATNAVREDGTGPYMMDCIYNDAGKIIQIRFDRVKKQ
ncbi:MAG: hypothetical protein MJ114_09120 [Acetatifactor sp.]|nr:hypothetical protein [Acetatifactor sp.]